MAESQKKRSGFFGNVWLLLKETGSDFSEDNATRLAAALAYYTVLSLAPLVVLALAIAGLAVDQDATREQLAAELGSVVGPSSADAVGAIVENAKTPSTGILSSVLGIVVLLFGASGVFGELQGALNTVWEVAPKPGRGIWGTIKDRLFSFAMVMGVAFLLLVSLLLSTAVAAVGRFLESSLPGGEAVWQVLNFLLSFAVVSALFAVTFKVVPDVKVKWKDVLDWRGRDGIPIHGRKIPNWSLPRNVERCVVVRGGGLARAARHLGLLLFPHSARRRRVHPGLYETFRFTRAPERKRRGADGRGSRAAGHGPAQPSSIPDVNHTGLWATAALLAPGGMIAAPGITNRQRRR